MNHHKIIIIKTKINLLILKLFKIILILHKILIQSKIFIFLIKLTKHLD